MAVSLDPPFGRAAQRLGAMGQSLRVPTELRPGPDDDPLSVAIETLLRPHHLLPRQAPDPRAGVHS